MPPDGTDLTELFVPGGFSIGGLLADDAVVRFVAPSAESSSTGPDGFFDTWSDWLEAWESYRLFYDDVVERGDSVVALVRLRGVTRRDRVEMEQEAAGIFRFDGDKVVEIEFNLDREDALAD
jgi:ketosteroid isomerase-like protein